MSDGAFRSMMRWSEIDCRAFELWFRDNPHAPAVEPDPATKDAYRQRARAEQLSKRAQRSSPDIEDGVMQ